MSRFANYPTEIGLREITENDNHVLRNCKTTHYPSSNSGLLEHFKNVSNPENTLRHFKSAERHFAERSLTLCYPCGTTTGLFSEA